MRKKAFPPHRHEWQLRATRDWRYICRICGVKSRNNFVQDDEFRQPLMMTSVVLIGPDAGRVMRSIVESDGTIHPLDDEKRSAGDGA